MTDLIGMVYPENETKLSWPIGIGVVCDENQTEQWHDQSYRCGLCQKQNRVVLMDHIKCNLPWKLERKMIRSIVQVWSTLNTVLSCHYQSDQVQSVMTTRHDNDVIDLLLAIYAEKETELLWLIRSRVVIDVNQIRQRRNRSYRCGGRQKQNWVIVTI